MKNGNIIPKDNEKQTKWHSAWWANRSKRQKNIIIAVLILLLVFLIIALLYLLFYVKIEICTTPSCVRTSMEVLKHIDVKVDPCEDFYRFSCGNFLQNTNLDNRESRSVRDIMEDQIQSQIRNMLEDPIQLKDSMAFNLAKKFYRACMNETAIEAEGLKRIKEIFRQIGGWPTVDGNNWQESQFDWKDVVHKLRRMGVNSDFFFRISLDRDKRDNSRYILGIHDMLYNPSEVSNEVKSMYLDYMVDITVLFGAYATTAREDSNKVLSILLKLAQISEDAQAENKTGSYNILSLSELQYQYPSIPWHTYINGILDSAETITHDDDIIVYEPNYVKKLEAVLSDTSKRSLANFIAWHTLQHLINYLPGEILDRAYEYLGKVNGKIIRKPRWKTCVKATEDRMSSVISAAYVQQFFDEDTRRHSAELIRNIKTQFKYTLINLQWVDENTKKMALEKLLSSVEYTVPYNDLMDILEESEEYYMAKVNESKLLDSALNLDYVSLNIEYSKLRKPAKDNWLTKEGFVTGLSIRYSPKENILRFPVGIFQGIYYGIDRPEYMNYGILGSIIAHKISHIFIGPELRDLPGDLRSWWSPKSLVNYEEKLQCLSHQYGNFAVAELGKHLSPVKIQDEDMADLAGMKVSYDTYINWVQENGAEPQLPGLNYSPNQLFWISSAIHHCSKYSSQTLERYIANYQRSPQQFRVNGPLQNLEEFAFDFRCPVKKKMNPAQKCVIW